MAITSIKNSLLCTAFVLTIVLPVTAHSTIISFHFTGNLMVAGDDQPINNVDESGNPIWLTPVSASLNYNTVSGFGDSNLSITMPDFLGSPTTLHDITLKYESGTNLINGNILVDWGVQPTMSMHIEWDATGFLNALSYNLKPGDTISGTILKQDTDGDGSFDTFSDVFSAVPYSDNLGESVISPPFTPEGPAPLAATAASLGMGYDIDGNYLGSNLEGIRGLINIGSGDSLTVTSVSAVPLPAVMWLFVSGLAGLSGIARVKRSGNKH